MTVRKHGVSVDSEMFNTLDGDPYAVINKAFESWFVHIQESGYTYEIIRYDTSQDLGDPNKTYIELEVYLTPKELELPKYDQEELIDFALRAFEADLLQQAKDTLELANKQLDEFLANCKKVNVEPTMMKNQRGGYVLLDLLLVKSQAISTITMLKENKG